jgi:hypothetical protein
MYPSGHGEAFCPDGSRFMANVSWEQYEDAMSLYVGSCWCHWRDEVPCVSQSNERGSEADGLPTPPAGEASAAHWQLFLLISAWAVTGVSARVVTCNVQISDVVRFEFENSP